jgi:hypothetical protein
VDFSDEVIDLIHDQTLAIDWNPAFVARYFNQREHADIWLHDSVTQHRKIIARPVSFGDCMARFTAKEELEGDGLMCKKCGANRKAFKTLELWTTPNILVIHLKRLLPDRKLFTLVRTKPLSQSCYPIILMDRVWVMK